VWWPVLALPCGAGRSAVHLVRFGAQGRACLKVLKGNQVNIPEPNSLKPLVVTFTEPQEVGGVPGKSSLFFFTIIGHSVTRPASLPIGTAEAFCSRVGGLGCSVWWLAPGCVIVLASLKTDYPESGNDD